MDIIIISNLVHVPDQASFDHFCSTLRKRKNVTQYMMNLHQILGA